MALPVTFSWLDDQGRTKRQTLTTTATTIADALTQVTAFVALMVPVSDAGLTEVTISNKDNGDAYAATAGSNVDVNASFQVQGNDGFKYDLDLPMIKDSKLAGGGNVNLADVDIIAWYGQFLTGGNWRVNNRFPTFITSVIKAVLDK